MTAISSRVDLGDLAPRPTAAARVRLSIIVAAERPRRWLEMIHAVLARYGGAAAVEIVVVRPGSALTDQRDGREPHLAVTSYLAAPADASRAELRAQGIRAATGAFVVLFDDERPLDPGGVDRVLRTVLDRQMKLREVRT